MSIKVPVKKMGIDDPDRAVPRKAEKAAQVSVNSTMTKQTVNKGTPNGNFINPSKSKNSTPKKSK